jgi:hypothetical protein
MKLKIWLVTNNMTLTKFCEGINHDITYISKICKGKKKPGRKLGEIIEKFTNGEVKMIDLLNDENDAHTQGI